MNTIDLTQMEMEQIEGGWIGVVVAIAVAIFVAVPTLDAPGPSTPLDPNLGETDLATGQGANIA